ncbi:MAG: mechanosensitive ion channel family protein [Mariniblastus sp.]|nr:mechanosensitive ion channel family protein [Mariniblastus sp.]
MLRTFPNTKPILPYSLIVFLSCWIGLCQTGWGLQTDDPAAQPAQSSQLSTTDPATSLSDLKLLIKPLTAAELKETASQWQNILQAKMLEIAHLKIAMNPTSTPQQDDELLKLIDEKAVIARHFGAVIDELEVKGGETKEYRQYAVSAAGVSLDYTNPSTVWKMIVSWIWSEDGGKRWAWNFLKFALILIFFYIGASIVANILCRFVAHVKGTSQLLISFLRTFTKQLLMVLGLVMALNALEVDITPMLAALGAAGFAIGLALKDTMGNFASGTMILAYRPFDVGDQIDAAGVNGLVESVSLSATHIRTFDNQLIIVPNSKIWGDIITNKTASDTRRVDMVFGIGYDDDIELAKKTLESLLQQHPLVLADPTPVVKLHELADSSVNFICRPWAKTKDYWAVYWDITRSVKETFDQEGISIPYPQRDVHLYQQSPAAEPGSTS